MTQKKFGKIIIVNVRTGNKEKKLRKKEDGFTSEVIIYRETLEKRGREGERSLCCVEKSVNCGGRVKK